MFLIWKEAKEYDIETVDLEERLLGQILFAESYVQDAMSVFLAFYENGRNRTLIKAFVSYYAYKYLVRDRIVDEETNGAEVFVKSSVPTETKSIPKTEVDEASDITEATEEADIEDNAANNKKIRHLIIMIVSTMIYMTKAHH